MDGGGGLLSLLVVALSQFLASFGFGSIHLLATNGANALLLLVWVAATVQRFYYLSRGGLILPMLEISALAKFVPLHTVLPLLCLCNQMFQNA